MPSARVETSRCPNRKSSTKKGALNNSACWLKTPQINWARIAEWDGDLRRHPGRRMTEAEFADWVGDKTRAEWVDGEVIVMSPVSREHGKLTWWLRTLIQFYADAKDLGVVEGPEFAVRLPKLRRRRTPDILFVDKSRLSILKTNHCEGAPDLIFEIVSSESVQRDWREKYAEYQTAGVKEYWVIDLASELVEQNVLGPKRKYVPMPPDKDGGFGSTAIKGLWLKKGWLLDSNRLSVPRDLKELAVSL